MAQFLWEGPPPWIPHRVVWVGGDPPRVGLKKQPGAAVRGSKEWLRAGSCWMFGLVAMFKMRDIDSFLGVDLVKLSCFC